MPGLSTDDQRHRAQQSSCVAVQLIVSAAASPLETGLQMFEMSDSRRNREQGCCNHILGILSVTEISGTTQVFGSTVAGTV